MNRQHLRAILWLRWRIRANQLKRGGIANAVILAILAVLAVAFAAGSFFAAVPIGIFVLNDVSPAVLMYVWDGIIVAFLFAWFTGVLTELQRSESLSLEKFLHLPVSLSCAFLINYLSSLASVTLLLFLPAMLGVSLGLLFGRGWTMLWLLPMLAAFLLMVTALTYQLQGWLATLMAGNPRRRRTIIVLLTMSFVLIAQLPQLVNWWFIGSLPEQAKQRMAQQNAVFQEWDKKMNQALEERTKKMSEINQERSKYNSDLKNCKSEAERKAAKERHQQRQAELQREYNALARYQERITEEFAVQANAIGQVSPQFLSFDTVKFLSTVLPPGWLALGVLGLGDGQLWPAMLGTLGLTLIGSASLWRAYRTTLRLYTGHYTSGKARTVPTATAKTTMASPGLLERKLPWLSEQAAVIALGGFRSLLRAPEAKIFLLTPVLMLMGFTPAIIFLSSANSEVPDVARSLFAFLAMAMILVGLVPPLGNQFGYDRNGFRVFVLSPASRRDILLGKNLAFVPIVLILGAAAALGLQWFLPLRVDHFLALVPRFVSMYLLVCLPANAMSILAPMRIAAGSFRAAQLSGIAILWNFLVLFLCPAVLAPTLLPLGIEWAAEEMGWRHGMPLDLIFTMLECVAIVCIYGLFLRWQSDWLQAREQRILQIVTTRAE